MSTCNATCRWASPRRCCWRSARNIGKMAIASPPAIPHPMPMAAIARPQARPLPARRARPARRALPASRPTARASIAATTGRPILTWNRRSPTGSKSRWPPGMRIIPTLAPPTRGKSRPGSKRRPASRCAGRSAPAFARPRFSNAITLRPARSACCFPVKPPPASPRSVRFASMIRSPLPGGRSR